MKLTVRSGYPRTASAQIGFGEGAQLAEAIRLPNNLGKEEAPATMDDFMAVLRREFEADEGSFLLTLRVELE